MPARNERLRLIALAVAAVLAILVAGVGGWLVFGRGGGGNAAVAIGGPFSLVDKDGHAFTDRNLLGRYALIYFGYTYCPDVCPTTLNSVGGALDLLGPQAARLQAVFITVDPQRDTPKVVGDYVAAFSPRLLGLTGTPEQVAAATDAYRVYAARHKTGPGPQDYTMDHSSLLYLMAPDGHFVTPIRADQTAAAMATEIKADMT